MKRKILFITAAVLLVCFLWFTAFIYLPSKYAVPILMYHNVDYNKKDILTVSPEDFSRQLMFLKKGNYNVITLGELADLFIYRRNIPAKTVVITFDDGKENNFTYAYTLLKICKIPATMFVIPGHCGSDGYLTIRQIKEMAQNNIDIGSHSLNDVWLPGCDDIKLREEVYGSKKALESITGKKANFISYPLGGFDSRVRMAVMKAGFRGGCATAPGSFVANNDIYALKRVKVSGKIAGNMFSFWFNTTGYAVWVKELKNKWKSKVANVF